MHEIGITTTNTSPVDRSKLAMQVEAILARVLGILQSQARRIEQNIEFQQGVSRNPSPVLPLLRQPLHFRRGMTRIKTSLD